MKKSVNIQSYNVSGEFKLAALIIQDQLDLVRRNNKSSLRWFNERSQDFGGYGWCLITTGLNPNFIRKIINKNKLVSHCN